MKLAILFLSICCALLLGGCADRSLMTDEEYANSRRPAPNSPDPTGYIPQQSTRPPGF
jgi:hypothetical protein